MTGIKYVCISLFTSIILLTSFFNFANAKEFDPGEIVAYPNPFNPVSQTLTIKPASASQFDGAVTYFVYDYNQKQVYTGTSAANSAIVWDGHSSSGAKVTSGLYFIKLVQTRSDSASGTRFIKVIIK